MILQLSPEDLMRQIQPLCDLLGDAVESGASIGFLPPLNPMEAFVFWDSVREAMEEGSRILLVAVEAGELVGTVQLELCTRANGAHRAEVVKLLVHRIARRRGIGAALLAAAEEAGRQSGRTLLVLDTRKGDPSEALYAKLGYTKAGEIPGYARSANGELHATCIFYKTLDRR
ncbi:MAG TPA: GNAT family N-acetyltransferase [Bryobacteraceae bacterium]|nr:GNAT family N-acetyltransferase [Bryobacteraceae bacterium]